MTRRKMSACEGGGEMGSLRVAKEGNCPAALSALPSQKPGTPWKEAKQDLDF